MVKSVDHKKFEAVHLDEPRVGSDGDDILLGHNLDRPNPRVVCRTTTTPIVLKGFV